MKKLVAGLVVVLMASCSSSYRHTSPTVLSQPLDPRRGVMVVLPSEGSFEGQIYQGSAGMTVNAITTAFSRYANRVDSISSCRGEGCIEVVDKQRFGYLIVPRILHWEDRATEWSGKPDKIEIQITVYDLATGEQITSGSFSGSSKWASLGGDHPQDLLRQPTSQFVDGLY
ncbi:MAG: DUF4823 domain-containing protein [Pseudomonadales bacterium]|jgi:hypothetical protein